MYMHQTGHDYQPLSCQMHNLRFRETDIEWIFFLVLHELFNIYQLQPTHDASFKQCNYVKLSNELRVRIMYVRYFLRHEIDAVTVVLI